MTIRIHDLNTGAIYTATCADDCRGVDRHAYEMACLTGRTVTMGKIIAEVL